LSDFVFEFFDMREVLTITAVFLIIKIVMDIRNRQEARREINMSALCSRFEPGLFQRV